MRTALLHLSVLAAITISVHSTAIIATTGTAATVGIGLTAVTAGTLANVALAAAGVKTAAVVGALAVSAIANKRRIKREASTCFGLDNAELMYILAANSDQLGCGQRLVCELEATEDAKLSDTEQQILQLFGRDVRPVKASQMLSPKSVYHYAAQVGAKASTVLECAEVFDLCPLDRVGIMDTYAQFAAAPVSP